ncbi:hypothetical protein IGI04_025764 [Brassica rapa subsp. trilocularis]|uniref:Uncharacterized protein n=1 Tax=Brassica rapa subsp. trilocularis TaxID=1813537 RepID=A0ABQ7KVB9_BRACM|nr:hypothetical protein IGI04_025764 [Brassica rapa subsp. trilocularis]
MRHQGLTIELISPYRALSTRGGRGKDGSVVIDNQSLDTQLNLATDFAGSLESISMVRSVGMYCILLFFCSLFSSSFLLAPYLLKTLI